MWDMDMSPFILDDNFSSIEVFFESISRVCVLVLGAVADYSFTYIGKYCRQDAPSTLSLLAWKSKANKLILGINSAY
jgi:hypothetical protein